MLLRLPLLWVAVARNTPAFVIRDRDRTHKRVCSILQRQSVEPTMRFASGSIFLCKALTASSEPPIHQGHG